MYNVHRGYVSMMFKKLVEKLYKEKQKHTSTATNPLNVDFEERKNVFLNKLTQKTLNLYEKQCDIKKFTKLALSNPENNSHNKIMEELFSKGIIDPTEDEKLLELSDNRRFLRDLGLTEEDF